MFTINSDHQLFESIKEFLINRENIPLKTSDKHTLHPPIKTSFKNKLQVNIRKCSKCIRKLTDLKIWIPLLFMVLDCPNQEINFVFRGKIRKLEQKSENQ